MLKINHGKKYVQDQQKQIMKAHIIYVKVTYYNYLIGMHDISDQLFATFILMVPIFLLPEVCRLS